MVNGFTPLFAACENNDLDVAKILVEAGADINAKSRDGRTPVQHALHHNRTYVADYLHQVCPRLHAQVHSMLILIDALPPVCGRSLAHLPSAVPPARAVITILCLHGAGPDTRHKRRRQDGQRRADTQHLSGTCHVTLALAHL